MLDGARFTEGSSRSLVCVGALEAARPGFDGRGHTAIEIIAPNDLAATDPFVLLIEDRIVREPGARVGGPHPHAGLETITFVLEGSLRDRDEGALGEGDLAWMTAGGGVIHGEDTRLPTGHVRLLQLWITLPERARAAPPRVQIVRRSDAPLQLASGVEARVYSGQTSSVRSPIRTYVPVTFLDVRLENEATFEAPLPASYNGFLLPLEGSVRAEGQRLTAGELGWLDTPERLGAGSLRITGQAPKARVVVVAGERQNERLVQSGPFVAGSRLAIDAMYRAFRAGRFTPISEL